jgi:hypothetical protein
VPIVGKTEVGVSFDFDVLAALEHIEVLDVSVAKQKHSQDATGEYAHIKLA